MKEATVGFDLRRALSVLQEVGALPPTTGLKGARAKPYRAGKGKKPTRLYPVDPAKLD
jgi:hypothetical protein